MSDFEFSPASDIPLESSVRSDASGFAPLSIGQVTSPSDAVFAGIGSEGLLSPPAATDPDSLRGYYSRQYLNFDNLSRNWQQQPFAETLSFFSDPIGMQAAALNQSFIAHDWGVTPQDIGFDAYPLHRDYYSWQNFGTVARDDSELLGLIKDRLASSQGRITPPPQLFTMEQMQPAPPPSSSEPSAQDGNHIDGSFTMIVPKNRVLPPATPTPTLTPQPTQPETSMPDQLVQMGRDYVDMLRQSHPNTPQYDDSQLQEIGRKVDGLRQLQQQAQDADAALHHHSLAGNAGDSVVGGMTDGALTVGQGFYTQAAQGLRMAFPNNETAQSLADEYERYSKNFDETRQHYRDFYGVDPQFANSFMGSVLAGAGQMVPQFVASEIPGVGLAALQNQGFQNEWDRARYAAQRDGKPFDTKRAFAFSFTAGMYDTLMQKVKFDAVFAKWWKAGGSSVIKKAFANITRAAVISGGISTVQGGIDDVLAKIFGIDDKAEPFDVKKRAEELLSGMGSGALFGGSAEFVHSFRAADNPYRDIRGKTYARPNPDLAKINPELAPSEKRMIATINHVKKADAAYDAHPDSDNGKVIAADISREVNTDYTESREGKILFSPATDRGAGAYADDRLWREIHNRGDRKTLLFTAGGVAAGKSSVTRQAMNKADLVFDGTMRDPKWAIQTINDALANGWKVEIVYVQRPLDLVAQGAIKRADKTGRWGPYANLPQTHLDAQKSIVTIAKYFEGNPNISIELRLNDGLHPSDPVKFLKLSEVDLGGKYNYSNTYDKNTGTSGKRPSEQGDNTSTSTNSGRERDSRSFLRPEVGRNMGAKEQSPERLQQDAQGGSAAASEGIPEKPFGWEVRGYTPEEHLRIFRNAAASGEFEPRVLRFLARGNPALETIVGKVRPKDIDIRAYQKRLRENK